MLTFGSLFAGIGGMDLGLERAGMRCVWQVEIDPYRRRVLEKHWPGLRRASDVRTFPPDDTWERPDLICGGFPCQDISLAGRRQGLKGERSGLWREFARVIRVFRPRFVLVENTPGLLAVPRQHRGSGQAPIGCVLGELAKCGYDAEWASVPAFAFGSTQERFRVFVVAYSRDQGIRRRVLPTRSGAETGDYAEFLADLEADADPQCGECRQRTAQVRDESPEWRAPSQPDRRDSIFTGSGWWAAEPPVVRMVYGVPRKLVRPAISGLGDSVIPVVAEWVGRRIISAA